MKTRSNYTYNYRKNKMNHEIIYLCNYKLVYMSKSVQYTHVYNVHIYTCKNLII